MQKGIMLKKCKKNKAYIIFTGMLSYLFSSSPAGFSLDINISLLPFHLFHSLRVFLRKTHPAPSARPFGAMRRLELWY